MWGTALVYLAAPNFMSFILGAKKLGCPNVLEIKLAVSFLPIILYFTRGTYNETLKLSREKLT